MFRAQDTRSGFILHMFPDYVSQAAILQRGRFLFIFKHKIFPLLGLTWKGKSPTNFNVAMKWKMIKCRSLTSLAEKFIFPSTAAKMLTSSSVLF